MLVIKSYIFRQAFCMSLAVAIAISVNSFYSFSHGPWMVLTAFLITETTRGTPIRQNIIYLIIILLALLVANWLLVWMKSLFLLEIIVAVIFFLSVYLSIIKQPLNHKSFYTIMLFSFILLIATSSDYHAFTSVKNQIIDSLIGAAIGISSGLLILSVGLAEEFRQGLLPVFTATIEYLQVLIPNTEVRQYHDEDVKPKRFKVEEELSAYQSVYPVWVYEVGFNPGFRAGFRFFLINLERIIEILFSLNNLFTQPISAELWQYLQTPAQLAMQKNSELLQQLKNYFVTHDIPDLPSDLINDIKTLEKKLRTLVPGDLALLDILPDYVILVAIVRDIKDIRQALLQLLMALPKAAT